MVLGRDITEKDGDGTYSLHEVVMECVMIRQ